MWHAILIKKLQEQDWKLQKGCVFALTVTKVVHKSVAKMNITSHFLGGGPSDTTLGTIIYFYEYSTAHKT